MRQLLLPISIVISFVLLLQCNTCFADSECFEAMYQFGDSLSDTGNLVQIVGQSVEVNNYPYGITFGHPTGRASDGLLMVDYFAMHFNLPLLNPYLASGKDLTHGVNFAVASATALDIATLAKKNVTLRLANVSLEYQLAWFKNHVHSICSNQSDCKNVLKKSLVVVGEIGGNDYNYALLQGKTLSDAYNLVPEVLTVIKQAVEEMIMLGAVNIVIPGNFPIGCVPAYLVQFSTNDSSKYDDLQCLREYNTFARFHNMKLRQTIQMLKFDHPGVVIAYGDYYSAYIWVLQNAASLGFEQAKTFVACCGAGNNSYNYDPTKSCGSSNVSVCTDPNTHIQWDGIHLTQQAYKYMSKFLMKQLSPAFGLN